MEGTHSGGPGPSTLGGLAMITTLVLALVNGLLTLCEQIGALFLDDPETGEWL